MKRITSRGMPAILLAGTLALPLLAVVPSAHAQESASPLENLPPHIRQLTTFGQRADWSHDGERILFLEKTYGDVYEAEVATGRLRPMTHHYYHEGYTRALYLANGDILLSGSATFDADDPGASRHEDNAELWVLKADLSGPPVRLGEHCKEGPAVSRKRMHLVWTRHEKFWAADIVYEDGTPRIANKVEVPCHFEGEAYLETQNLRPPEEKELIFSAYNYQGGEVFGLNLETGKTVNYSNAPQQYDEPEGIFPDGQHTLTECNHHDPRPDYIQNIDIYKLALDGSGKTQRITYFANYPGYKASNPVVSDDGRYMAFQVAKLGDKAGVGRGILIFDLELFARQ